MVTLPEQFVSTWLDGYFWNTETQTLYSLKVDGVLKPLAKVFPSHFNHIHCPGWRVSVKGQRKFMAIDKLRKLGALDSEIRVVEK